MEQPQLSDRIERYLQRLTHWVESETGNLAELEGALSLPETALEDLLAGVLRSGRQLETLRTEHGLLQREWHSAEGIETAAREALEQRYAEQARAIDALAQRRESVINRIETRKRESGGQLTEMLRGRAMLRGYSSGKELEPGYVDKKS